MGLKVVVAWIIGVGVLSWACGGKDAGEDGTGTGGAQPAAGGARGDVAVADSGGSIGGGSGGGTACGEVGSVKDGVDAGGTAGVGSEARQGHPARDEGLRPCP